MIKTGDRWLWLSEVQVVGLAGRGAGMVAGNRLRDSEGCRDGPSAGRLGLRGSGELSP